MGLPLELLESKLAEPTLPPWLKELSELEEPSGPKPMEFNESDEGPELEDADESSAVIVVVTTGAGVSLTTVSSDAATDKRASARIARIIAAWSIKRSLELKS